MVSVRLFSGAVATIHRNELKNKIAVRVKSFHGLRKIYTIEVEIDKTIDDLKELLLNADSEGDFKEFIQLNLIHTIVSYSITMKGKLKELSGKEKIVDSGITHKTLLIVVGIKYFTWDASHKGDNIDVKHLNNVAK